jgi:glycolate oxidase
MPLKTLAASMEALVQIFSGICGEKFVFTDPEDLLDYERDQTLNFRYPFDFLIKPGSPKEISDILKVCNYYKIPVTPRGGGSGVTGGALPVQGGVVLSLERLNKIISIDKTDLYVIAESGVITAELCKSVNVENLYFPVFPGSGSYSFIGGNVAQNAGAINSCKFGTTSQYVLNLEVVLPTGEIIWTGSNVAKSSTGLDLTRLFVGSEGILGVITKIVYRLLPPFLPEVMILTAFDSLKDAHEVILTIRRAGLMPSAAELIGREAIDRTNQFLGISSPPVTDQTQAILLLGIQERYSHDTDRLTNELTSILSAYTDTDIFIAQTELEKEKMCQLRVNIGNAMTSGNCYYRDIDACIPLQALYDYIRKVETICCQHHLPLVYFGHALDGNIHTMILLGNDLHDKQQHQLDMAVFQIFQYVVSVGGSISGEHGIGMLQKNYLELQFSDTERQVMKNIKTLFDPNNIVNPGKIIM